MQATLLQEFFTKTHAVKLQF
uniref:Uncharacterized protein n=1 Tax=Arundo donax TaxID=35708 RepID=A0A0A8ZB47_ARUDO